MKQLSISQVIAAVFFAGLFLSLDAAGAFIYIGYFPLYASAAICLWHLLARKYERRNFAFAIILLLIGVVLLIPILRTSGRKSFYLDAVSIRPGMQMSVVRGKMGAYDSYGTNERLVTFSYQSGSQTVDHLIMEISPDLQFVDSVEYSVD